MSTTADEGRRRATRSYALASRVDESRDRFLCECERCGEPFIGGRSADLCPDCRVEEDDE